MTILTGDIKLLASKVMDDVPNGGGGPTGTVIPDGSLAFGSPARVKGPLDEEGLAQIRRAAASYQQEAMDYKTEQETPHATLL